MSRRTLNVSATVCPLSFNIWTFGSRSNDVSSWLSELCELNSSSRQPIESYGSNQLSSLCRVISLQTLFPFIISLLLLFSNQSLEDWKLNWVCVHLSHLQMLICCQAKKRKTLCLRLCSYTDVYPFHGGWGTNAALMYLWDHQLCL